MAQIPRMLANSERTSHFHCTSSRPWPCLRLTWNLGLQTELSTSEPGVTTQDSTQLHTAHYLHSATNGTAIYQLNAYLSEHRLANYTQPRHKMDEVERSSSAEKKPCPLWPPAVPLCSMAALAPGCHGKADTYSVWLYYSTAKSNAQPLLPQMSIFHLNWDKAKKLEYCLIMHSKSARVENNGELIRSLKL